MQAPNNSLVDHYVIYTRVMDGVTTITIPASGVNMTHNFTIYQENVVYEFAVQAVNEEGNGPISNYTAVSYCSVGE